MYLDFDENPVEFGIDNCATHHICSNKSLFHDGMKSLMSVGVRDINGVAQADGVGTINFTITDNNDIDHSITLDNVIYLPSASKNLISISQWSKDKGDNCAVMSRGNYSNFYWGDDSFNKSILHRPSCRIPLMRVNEKEAATSAFFVADHNTETGRATDSDQQSDEVHSSMSPNDSNYSTGSTVRSNIDGKSQISVITQPFRTTAGCKRYKIRHLNETDQHTVSPTELQPINPEPADIPLRAQDVDRSLLRKELSTMDVTNLWSGSSDSTVSEADRITLYWHHRLRHAPLVFLRRLSARGILPACIKKVFKMPLCAACAFSAAHRRNWRSKGAPPSSIRDKTNDKPGSGTSADHIISKRSGLIP